MQNRRERELALLPVGKRVGKGCCTSHPVACTSFLLALGVLCTALLVCGVVFHPAINQKVQDAIGEVSGKSCSVIMERNRSFLVSLAWPAVVLGCRD